VAVEQAPDEISPAAAPAAPSTTTTTTTTASASSTTASGKATIAATAPASIWISARERQRRQEPQAHRASRQKALRR